MILIYVISFNQSIYTENLGQKTFYGKAYYSSSYPRFFTPITKQKSLAGFHLPKYSHPDYSPPEYIFKLNLKMCSVEKKVRPEQERLFDLGPNGINF